MSLKDKLTNAKLANDDLFSDLTAEEKSYENIMAKIAITIHNSRKKRNMNQVQFAQLMGISQTMVSKWESGDYNFTIENVIQIFEKLDLKFDIIAEEKHSLEQTNAAYNVLPFPKQKWATISSPTATINDAS